KTNYSEKKLR
ncbi:hypothetical protein JTB14_008177, partial [Gonioctena quinquepunctata]